MKSKRPKKRLFSLFSKSPLRCQSESDFGSACQLRMGHHGVHRSWIYSWRKTYRKRIRYYNSRYDYRYI